MSLHRLGGDRQVVIPHGVHGSAHSPSLHWPSSLSTVTCWMSLAMVRIQTEDERKRVWAQPEADVLLASQVLISHLSLLSLKDKRFLIVSHLRHLSNQCWTAFKITFILAGAQYGCCDQLWAEARCHSALSVTSYHMSPTELPPLKSLKPRKWKEKAK